LSHPAVGFGGSTVGFSGSPIGFSGSFSGSPVGFGGSTVGFGGSLCHFSYPAVGFGGSTVILLARSLKIFVALFKQLVNVFQSNGLGHIHGEGENLSFSITGLKLETVWPI
jgi:hypothetical protein